MTTLTAPDISTTAPGFRAEDRAAETGADYFSRHRFVHDDKHERWAMWLNGILDDPSSVEDDLTTAPSWVAVRIALDYLAHMVSIGAPPEVVTLGPNGEIVFERRGDLRAEQIVINDDLSVEWIAYEDARLVDRRVIVEAEPVGAW